VNRERIRILERARTTALNTCGLTSRGTPMQTRRRVYSIDPKARKLALQKERRERLAASGLTILGTVPKRGLALKWEKFRAALNAETQRSGGAKI